jgi:choline dehydrogenase-like flavoprotein
MEQRLNPGGPAVGAAIRSTTRRILRGADSFDALVIGAGAAGGLAALLLVEAGLRVLVLDAGATGVPRCSLSRWLIRGTASRFLERAADEALDRRRQCQPIQSLCHVWWLAPEAFVDDYECPYTTPPNRPFLWFRARQLGGRMVIPGHGRQYYRLGPDDFAPADGLSAPWPLQPGELDPWYGLVERRLALVGARDGLPWLPDGELSQTIRLTPPEAALQAAISARWPSYKSVLARFAPPLDALEAAARTKRLFIRQGAVVREIEVDGSGRARGVIWLDQRQRREKRTRAPLIFLCASALESTRVLLLSRSSQSARGLGAASGVLGRGLMDHVKIQAVGEGPPLAPDARLEEGRCLYLPRFDSRGFGEPRPGRGFGVQLYQKPAGPGHSHFSANSYAEMPPRDNNRVMLDPQRRDAWGVPVLRIECAHGETELARAQEQGAALRALAEVADVRLTRIDEVPAPPGASIHECGTARMGSDPANSVLDPHNQCWDAQGLYVTDGACFPSQGSQNPTLTILALTARACDHAVRTMRDSR